MNTLTAQLDQLADYRAQRDVLALDKQAAIDSILTPEIKAQLSALEFEFADKFQALDRNLSELESDIKAQVLAQGQTIKGQRLMAIFNKGRVSWETKFLDGFAVAHPEILAFRKEGEPSVTIRVNGGVK